MKESIKLKSPIDSIIVDLIIDHFNDKNEEFFDMM